MSADRELMELAAKAAGASWTDYSDCTPDHWHILNPDGVWREWRPLADDGDALRLAVSVKRLPELLRDGNSVCNGYERDGRYRNPIIETFGDDPSAAVRRAIVRAAAEIGRSMP